MEENRNNGMNPNMGGMPNIGGMPNMGGMNQNMNGMGMNPNMGGMNPAMGGMPGAGGMNPNMGGMNRPPMPAKPGAPAPQTAGAASTALVPVGKAKNEPDKKKKKKKSCVASNIFAVLLFLLMAGGLFLGMAGPFWSYLESSSLFLPSGVENTTLKGSLVGILVDGIMNIGGYLQFDMSGGAVVGIMNAFRNLLPAISLLILAVSVVYALIATLIAFFSRASGKRALAIVSSSMLVGYGGCGFFTLIFGDTDFGCLALAAVGLIVACIMALVMNKQIGLVNVFISLFSIAATVLFALPMSALRQYSVESGKVLPDIFGFVALGILYANLFFTSARICAKKGKIFDLIFHVLQFAVITTIFVMALLSKDPAYNLFGMFMPIVCAVGAPALALIALALSIVIIFMPKIMKKAEEKKAKKAGKVVTEKTKDKKKDKKESDEQRPMSVPSPALPNGVAANATQAQPQRAPAPAQQAQPQRPVQQQQPPMRPMQPQQPQNRPPVRQNPQRADDEFSRSATSFKVPFSTGGGNKKDPATQAALEKLAAEMQAMKEAQSAHSSKTSIEINQQEDAATKAALENLTEQLRAMKEAQKQTANQGDAETKSAIEQLTEELRAMKEAQAKMEEERRLAEENRIEAMRKAQDDARIAEAERKAQEAKAEAERIAKEAEEKAEQARLEAARQTEEERKKLEEERKKLEEERKAAEEARLEAERKAKEAREEAERRAEEARLEAERKEAERKAEEERRAQEEARLEAERKAQEAREEAARIQREAEAAKAEAERKAEEERRKLEEEKKKLEEERKAMEAARLEEERKRKEELEQLKQELREMKNQPAAPAPAPTAPADNDKDESMERIMEELRSLRESQGNTTVNYMQDDSEQLNEFQKRMEDLIRSQQKEAPKREPTAFEKRMAQLAAKKAAAAESGVAAAPQQPVRPAAPSQRPEPSEPARYNTQSGDPFIATLTTKEVNEFGDVFIADKLGILSYMPAYVIGGDNKTFFNKVFIYLGKFRSQVSPSLVDKLFKFMRSSR